MTVVQLRPITVDNWKACIALTVGPEQQVFVPSNLYSIAEAQFYPDAQPLAIYNVDGVLVGFVMYGRDVATGRWKIFRLMIDAFFQGQGYGRAALAQMVERIAAKPDGGAILVCYHSANEAARRLYTGFGFAEQSTSAEGVVTALRTELGR